ncbi:zinc ribbon domain-containing protein YjdM [Neisseriaceae bacterium ESL0693]|nr:zinc ribbon domain-containing protein YjdM [Neisseriaceae bacterium ESL0693]
MSETTPICPQCGSNEHYFDGTFTVCLGCGHEWDADAGAENESSLNVKDSNGNPLASGDDVILIKDLKLKGSSSVLKKGAKAKNIRLVEGDHEIDCKIDGIKIMLKACFVKKV